jgi:uncharacterized membrane protein YjjB (DUF3815 family)
MLDEKNVPTWMLVAVVAGLGELTYWLYSRYGMNLAVQGGAALTAIAAIGCTAIYLLRLRRRVHKKSEKKLTR